jgi:hypothetical protein
VPWDMSIVGFDSIEFADEIDALLTTINMHAAEISRLAADYLISALEGNLMPITNKLATTLIIRRDSAGHVRPPAKDGSLYRSLSKRQILCGKNGWHNNVRTFVHSSCGQDPTDHKK